MGIGGQREGAEASVVKQYAHTSIILHLCIYSLGAVVSGLWFGCGGQVA